MPRKLLIHKTKLLFHRIKENTWYASIAQSTLSIRVIIGLFCIVYGLIGMISPLPLGLPVLLIGLSFLIGLHRVKVGSIRIIHTLKLHILFSRIYLWWKRR